MQERNCCFYAEHWGPFNASLLVWGYGGMVLCHVLTTVGSMVLADCAFWIEDMVGNHPRYVTSPSLGF